MAAKCRAGDPRETAMLAKVWTCAVVGLEGELVQVEVDISRYGLSKFTNVGVQ